MKDGLIKIRGAREHNLKGIDLDIPREKLVVITGLSGSGKSSLAFDTIYAEGQRRYVESLSTYARQFLGQMEKPNVESIDGLTPTIAIEQRSGQATPRSTVATTTEIYDYLRVLYARAGVPFCPICGRKIASQSVQSIVDHLLQKESGVKLQILAPLVQRKKGEHRDVFEACQKNGFLRVRVNKKIYRLEEVPSLDRKLQHTIELVVDRLILKADNRSSLFDSIEIALKQGQGLCIVLLGDKEEEEVYSEHFACPEHGSFLKELSPRIFSFNAPFGACASCFGLGNLLELDPHLVIANPKLSLKDGAIEAWKVCGSGMGSFYPNSVERLAALHKISVDTPFDALSQAMQKKLLYGSDLYEGILPNLKRRFNETDSEILKARMHEQFMSNQICEACHGTRLKPEVLAVKFEGKSIADLAKMSVEDALQFFHQLKVKKAQELFVAPLQKAVVERLEFLFDVGLGYMNLSRATRTLSGGEAQRIKLASQIGAKLSGITYVLDEPTIGLHQKDNDRLLRTLKALRELGNTVLVVEHDEDVIEAADYLIDIGPLAGKDGGQLVVAGSLAELKKASNSLTGKYLSGALSIPVPPKRRKWNKDAVIACLGCEENNLKQVDIKIPLNTFTCVTGVSGAGKSTLVYDCLALGIKKELGDWGVIPGKYRSLQGVQKIAKLIYIDQSPIGQTSRSNPATYTGCFDFIRQLFATVPEAKARGYLPGRFSFNVKGGRCEECQGHGFKVVEMHFLPSVNVLCEVCGGERYNKETLQVKFKGKNIAQVLDMTITEACSFFEHHRYIAPYMELMDEVGLGYLKLGQPSTTLSGGEAQRIKLCSELARKSINNILYLMDEPTTGLHFHDISKLLTLIQKLVDRGNSVVVIEHNLDVIKSADWVIDVGPDGGVKGGEIVAEGTPEMIIKQTKSYTASYLAHKLALS